MKYLYILLAIAAIALIIGACKGSKKSTSTASAKTPTIELTKGKCYGKCKTYTFSLYEDHSAAFVGVKNVDYVGAHHAQISANVYKEIVDQLTEADVKSMDNEYLSNARDLAELKLTFNGKTIRFQNRKAPAALREIVAMLDEIAFAQAWETNK